MTYVIRTEVTESQINQCITKETYSLVEHISSVFVETQDEHFEEALLHLGYTKSPSDLNQIAAQAIRNAVEECRQPFTKDGLPWLCPVKDLLEYADKMEQSND